MAGAVRWCDSCKIAKGIGLLVLIIASSSALPDDNEFYGLGHRSDIQLTRFKRQADRNQILNDIFQIPIQTLTAVQTLLQHTRPVFPNLYTSPSQSGGGGGGGGGGAAGSASGFGTGSGTSGGGFFGFAPGGGAGSLTRPRPQPPVSASASSPASASRPPPPAPAFDFFGRPRPSRGPLSFGANAVQVRPADDGSSFKI